MAGCLVVKPVASGRAVQQRQPRTVAAFKPAGIAAKPASFKQAVAARIATVQVRLGVNAGGRLGKSLQQGEHNMFSIASGILVLSLDFSRVRAADHAAWGTLVGSLASAP